MGKKRRLRAGGTAGSGGRAAGTAGILALPDDVMVQIFQHVEDGNPLLVVIPSVSVLGQPGPDYFGQLLEGSVGWGMARSVCPLPPDWSRVGRESIPTKNDERTIVTSLDDATARPKMTQTLDPGIRSATPPSIGPPARISDPRRYDGTRARYRSVPTEQTRSSSSPFCAPAPAPHALPPIARPPI